MWPQLGHFSVIYIPIFLSSNLCLYGFQLNPLWLSSHDPLADVINDDPWNRIRIWLRAAESGHCQLEGKHEHNDDWRKAPEGLLFFNRLFEYGIAVDDRRKKPDRPRQNKAEDEADD